MSLTGRPFIYCTESQNFRARIALGSPLPNFSLYIEKRGDEDLISSSATAKPGSQMRLPSSSPQDYKPGEALCSCPWRCCRVWREADGSLNRTQKLKGKSQGGTKWLDVSLCEMQSRAEGQIPSLGVRPCQFSLSHCSGKITAPTLLPRVARKQYWPSANLMPAQGSGVRGDSIEADTRRSEGGGP